MNRKPAPLLVFLVLLAFAGQLLAAPLSACHQSGQMSLDEHGAHGGQEMSCCPLHMAAGSGEKAVMAMPDTQETPAAYASMAYASIMDACDQHCFQCPALIPGEAASVLAPPTPQARASGTFIPPFRLDGPFRPPQIA